MTVKSLLSKLACILEMFQELGGNTRRELKKGYLFTIDH
jgi:hypothetical protein